jgi:hypothetical protein
MPGEYVVIDKSGLAQGTLDGSPNAPHMLGAGPHRFAPPNDTHYAVLWAPAFARGFSPFHLKDLDF